jgi:Tfp pilus assembly major pilin PilA
MLEISHQTQKRTSGDAPPSGHIKSERGFTLIEVMVTIGILMFGLLTVLQLTEVSNRNTTSTAARVTASNVARRVAEVAKSLSYSDLTQANGPAAIQADAPDLADSDTSDTVWTVVRESKTIEITPTFCAVDDPRDGVGAHDAGFCGGQPAATTPPDATPTDLIRMTTLVQVDGGRFRTTSVIPVNTSIDLPRVQSVDFAPGTTSPITSQSVTSAGFNVTTVNQPSKMSWLLDGTVMDSCTTVAATTCSGSGDSWSFTSALGTPVLQGSGSPNTGLCQPSTDPGYVNDGFHKMGARVFDSTGRSGAESSKTVEINRCQPFAVTNFMATSGSGTPPAVDIEWAASGEGDVLGYRVYKSTQAPVNNDPALPGGTQICPSAGVTDPFTGTACTDFSPPSGACASGTDHYYYAIRAVDRDSSGALREGSLASTDICTGNTAPGVPGSFGGSRSGSDNTLTWTVPADADTGDSIKAFRIYRNTSNSGPSPSADRIAYKDVLDACTGSSTGSSCSFTESIGSSNYYYWVTAVDSHLRESSYTASQKLP